MAKIRKVVWLEPEEVKKIIKVKKRRKELSESAVVRFAVQHLDVEALINEVDDR